MTKTIAINAGSSSLKWQLYEMPDEVVLAKGLIERIGLKDSVSTVKFDDRSESQTLDIADHVQAVKILLDDLIRFDIIKAYDEITGVGHRVVAGGEYFKESTVVEGDVLEKIEELAKLREEKNYNFLIEVDGGINIETSKACRDKGADLLVCGSFLFGASDKEKTLGELLK